MCGARATRACPRQQPQATRGAVAPLPRLRTFCLFDNIGIYICHMKPLSGVDLYLRPWQYSRFDDHKSTNEI